MTLHTLYIRNAAVHAIIDQDARLLHLFKVPGGRIVSGSIITTELVEGLLQPGFDGERLSLCAWGMLRVMEYVERTSRPATSDKAKAARVRSIVRSMGFRDDVIRALIALQQGQTLTCERGEFQRRVVEQLAQAHRLYGWAGMTTSDDTIDRGERIIAAMV